MQYLYWAITIIAIAGAILNVRHNRYGFFLWMVSNAALLFHNLDIKQYAQAALFAVYWGLACWGWFTWKNVEKKK